MVHTVDDDDWDDDDDDKNIAILETSGAHSRSEKKVTALVSVALVVSLSVFAISPIY